MAKIKSSFIDRSIDFIFSNDERKWLLLILIIGIVLRFFVASNATPVADEVVHGTHAMGISSLRPLSTVTQCPLWFYLTDFAYNLFGISLFSARFLSFLFGSLSIILIYMITKLITDKKTALIAAFLLAVSTFHIGWLTVYMDEAMMFFILFAIYYFIKTYQEKGEISILSAVFLGIGIQIKIITFVFSVIFCLFILIILYNNYRKDRKLLRKNFKKAVIFALILLVSCLPLFAYNYFLYQSKGIVDLPFSLYFDINKEFYQGPGLAHENGFVLSSFPSTIYLIITAFFIRTDPILFFLAVLGIPLFYFEYKNRKIVFSFLATIFLFAFFFIAASVVLPNHYTSFSPFFAILGALFISYISKKTEKYISPNRLIKIVCIIMLILSVYQLYGAISSKSAYDKMRNFAVEEISNVDLVVVDGRIYRGSIAWMFNDKHYIESSIFSQLYTPPEPSGKMVIVKTWFVECAPDDCGWGTISQQADFNKSTEEMFAIFKNGSTLQKEILGGGDLKGIKGGEAIGELYFRVYAGNIQLDAAALPLVDQTHQIFFYPLRRNLNPQAAFDYYIVQGTWNQVLNVLAYAVLYFYIVTALVSILFVFYVLFKD